jgi:hypothetical protein
VFIGQAMYMVSSPAASEMQVDGQVKAEWPSTVGTVPGRDPPS